MTISNQVITFWREAGAAKWFARDDAFDAEFRQRFESAHFAAARGEYEAWMESGEGALALQILLDQFPRNSFRGTAHSYATDGLARHYAQRAVEAGLDRDIEAPLRVFCYMAFEHSESLPHQDQAVSLIATLGDAEFLRYAELHRDVIQRFGRFPHRNAALGRETTHEERDYLANGGFSA